MVRSRLAALLAVPFVMLLAACGGSDDTGGLPEAGSNPTDSTSSTPATPTAVPTPTIVPATSTQKYGTLTLVLNHKPTPPANATAVLQAYDAFERASHKTQATNVEDPSLVRWGAGAALNDIRSVVQDQKAKKVRTGGAITVTTKVVKVSEAAAALDTCYDQSKSLLVQSNGSSAIGPGAKKNPRLSASVILVNVTGLWKVTEYNLRAEPC